MAGARPPILLYSATTTLAYRVAQKYYGQKHYAWCAPAADPDRYAAANPPSSDPLELYRRYQVDALSDSHSPLVEGNRRGIARGASEKERTGVISREERALIEKIAEHAPVTDFAPLLLVIPYAGAKRFLRAADLHVRARITSEEYIVEDLPRRCFDVLRLPEVKS